MKPATPLTAGQQLAKELAENVTDERLAVAISEALTATQINRDGTITPDHKTRLQAATLGLAYRHGRPVERQEVVSVNLDAEASIGLEERLANSPALLRNLKAIFFPLVRWLKAAVSYHTLLLGGGFRGFSCCPEFVIGFVPIHIGKRLFYSLQKIRLIKRLKSHVLILNLENHFLD